MRINGATRQLTAWILCFTILLVTFAPSISAVLAKEIGFDSAWMEVCSATTSKFVQASDSYGSMKSPTGSHKGAHMDHCPFCFTHAASFSAPPTAAFVFPIVGGLLPFPSLFYQAPRSLFIWAIAQSRAPPLIS